MKKRLTLRLEHQLWKELKYIALKEETSLNQLIVNSLTEKVEREREQSNLDKFMELGN